MNTNINTAEVFVDTDESKIINFTQPALEGVKNLKERTGKTAEKLAPDVISALLQFGFKNQTMVVNVVEALVPVAKEFFNNFELLVQISEKNSCKDFGDILKYLENEQNVSEEFRKAVIDNAMNNRHREHTNGLLVTASVTFGALAIIGVVVCTTAKFIVDGKVDIEKAKTLRKIAPKILKAKDRVRVEDLIAVMGKM